MHDRQTYRNAADVRLGGAAFSPRRLILIHSGVALGVTLLITLIDYWLFELVNAHTGGLSGVQLRSVLQTVATALQYVQLIGIPFWSVGLYRAVLQLARGQQTYPGTLLEGFRRFGPVLRHLLLELLIYMTLAFVCCWVGSILFVMTPFAAPLFKLMQPILQAQTSLEMETMMTALDQTQLLQAMLPAMVLIGILCLIVMLPLAYRLRMSRFLLMDRPGTGALAAILASIQLMRGNCLSLLKLDLQFWHYYLLSGLLTALPSAVLQLPALGVQLPMDENAFYLCCYGLATLAALALQVWLLPRVQLTYALVYDSLMPSEIKGESHHV